MNRQDENEALERAKTVLLAIDKEKQELGNKASESKLPYPIFWLTNLGVASGMPRYASLTTLLLVFVCFVPELAWAAMGIDGKRLVLQHPKFIQYFVFNSAFPNTMFVFWYIAPFVLLINTALFLKHIHFPGYQAFLGRRNATLLQKRKASNYSFAIQCLFVITLYLWVVIWNIGPSTFFRGFNPYNNRLALFVIHALQIAMAVPVMVALITAEIRANLYK